MISWASPDADGLTYTRTSAGRLATTGATRAEAATGAPSLARSTLTAWKMATSSMLTPVASGSDGADGSFGSDGLPDGSVGL